MKNWILIHSYPSIYRAPIYCINIQPHHNHIKIDMIMIYTVYIDCVDFVDVAFIMNISVLQG